MLVILWHMPLPHLYLTSPRGQCAVVLLAALRDLYVNHGRGTVTNEREAIEFIRCRHWFALEQQDISLSFAATSFARTALAYVDCLVARILSLSWTLMSYEARDSWGLTCRGRNTIDRVQRHRYSLGELHVAPCYLWSANFQILHVPRLRGLRIRREEARASFLSVQSDF